MKVRISKAEVLKAIAEEPLLSPGRWMTHKDGAKDPATLLSGDTENCKVCAVGAVFRRLLPLDTPVGNAVHCLDLNITWHNCMDEDNLGENRALVLEKANDILEQGSPWNALSYAFEGLCQAYDIHAFSPMTVRIKAALEAVRLELAEFVTAKFPDDIEINVAGYKPRIPYKELA